MPTDNRLYADNGLGPLSDQRLPLVSYEESDFCSAEKCFAVALGIPYPAFGTPSMPAVCADHTKGPTFKSVCRKSSSGEPDGAFSRTIASRAWNDFCLPAAMPNLMRLAPSDNCIVAQSHNVTTTQTTGLLSPLIVCMSLCHVT